MVKEKKCERVLSCVKCKQKYLICLYDDSRISINVISGVDKVVFEILMNCINVVGVENL